MVPGGAAKPNPKMGQALGPLGINMVQFCKVPFCGITRTLMRRLLNTEVMYHFA